MAEVSETVPALEDGLGVEDERLAGGRDRDNATLSETPEEE